MSRPSSDFARQGVAVRVQAGGGEADDRVARAPRGGRRRSRRAPPSRSRRRRRRRRGPCRRAGRAPRRGSRSRPGSRRAARPTPIASQTSGFGPVDRDVVEHRQRLGADADHVVDVHRHAVDPDRVELPERFGEHQLGPDPVGRQRDAEVRRHLDHARVVAGQRHLRRGPSQLDLPQRPHQPGHRRVGGALVDPGSRVGVAHRGRFCQSIRKAIHVQIVQIWNCRSLDARRSFASTTAARPAR